jgi:hypothetical protein
MGGASRRVPLRKSRMWILTCSVMLVSRWRRRRQYSSSVSGPESLVSQRERSVSVRNASTYGQRNQIISAG